MEQQTRAPLVLSFALLAALLGTTASRAQDLPAASPPATSVKERQLPDGIAALVNGREITRAELRARLVRKASSSERDAILAQLMDNQLISQEMKRRKLEVTEADIDLRIATLGDQIKAQSQGKTTLDAEIERSGVSLADFRLQLRYLLALETMARKDFGIPDGEEVAAARMTVWLADARGKAALKKEGLPDGVAAMVNSEPVYDEQVGRELERSLGKSETRSALNALIGMRLVRARMAEVGVTVSPLDLEHELSVRRKQFEKNPRFDGIDFAQFLQATRSQTPEQMKADDEFLAQVGLKKVVLKVRSEEELRRHFEENRELYGPLIRASHILIKASEASTPGSRSVAEAKELIEKVAAELKAGADFAAVASKQSEDTSRAQGGDVGFFPPKGVMDEAFAKAAAALSVGAISEPVRTAAGWHLILVTERKPPPTFDEVREEVVTDLSRRLYKELVQKADIAVNP